MNNKLIKEMTAAWHEMYPDSAGFGNTDRFIVGAIKWLAFTRKISISWDDGWIIEGHPENSDGYVAGDERLVDALCGAIFAESGEIAK